jgi:hypothetical protein
LRSRDPQKRPETVFLGVAARSRNPATQALSAGRTVLRGRLRQRNHDRRRNQ